MPTPHTPSQPSPTNLSDELRDIIVKHTSAMLDSPDKYGIYPTTKFYNDLIAAITAAYAEAIRGCVPEKMDAEMRSFTTLELERNHFGAGYNAAIKDMLDNLKKKGLL